MIDLALWTLTFGVAAFVFLQFSSTSRKVQRTYTELRVGGSPPSWLFGVVWPLLYTLITINIVLFASRVDNFTIYPATYDAVFWLWVVNLLLNKAWGVAFNWAFIEPSTGKFWALFGATLLVAGTAIAVLILEALSAEPWWSIVFFVGPYVLWTSFASVLMARFAIAVGAATSSRDNNESEYHTDEQARYVFASLTRR